MKPAHPTLPGIPAPPPKPRPERPVTAMDWCRAEAVDFGEVLDVLTRMGQESPLRRVYLGAVAALGLLRRPAKGEPIPLLAADTGEVMALACPTCRNVRVAGYVCGGYRPNDPRRHLDSVADCCRCACGAVTGPLQRECAACAAKEAPAREAAAAVEEERAESEAQTFAAMLRGCGGVVHGHPLWVRIRTVSTTCEVWRVRRCRLRNNINGLSIRTWLQLPVRRRCGSASDSPRPRLPSAQGSGATR
jgi:hypothetical protein